MHTDRMRHPIAHAHKQSQRHGLQTGLGVGSSERFRFRRRELQLWGVVIYKFFIRFLHVKVK
ncbi:hypothetical protein XELAEV_18025530mg [Xenopus laevis]|uniref:Uncharacterized protein n=1 Tax=Xenopus laevis TaxID=8355 RepID=A0A974D0X9_XENLA|nr:hypothetical protein XELAEV_18025530mg [Xenopus laevis]